MRKLIAPIIVALAVILTPVTSVQAVTGNYIQDFDHPFVGLAVFYDSTGTFLHRCSGSLLTPTIFLTAGHCIDDAASARVYFEQDAGVHFDPATEYDPVSGYPTDCLDTSLCTTSSELYNFGFSDFSGFPNTEDVGLLILDSAIDVGVYGALPSPGTLDSLATQRGLKDLTFTVSGYGLSQSNPVHVESYRERLMATSRLVNHNRALNAGITLQTTGSRGGGRGGTCSGDSGGPVFYPSDSNVIVAVTSFGLNPWCRGVDFAYRTDQQEVIDWIMGIVGPDAGIQIV
jgi:hypothetical protein